MGWGWGVGSGSQWWRQGRLHAALSVLGPTCDQAKLGSLSSPDLRAGVIDCMLLLLP